jgi:hypothetical protein
MNAACWTSGSDLGERWPSRLVATAAEKRLSCSSPIDSGRPDAADQPASHRCRSRCRSRDVRSASFCSRGNARTAIEACRARIRSDRCGAARCGQRREQRRHGLHASTIRTAAACAVARERVGAKAFWREAHSSFEPFRPRTRAQQQVMRLLCGCASTYIIATIDSSTPASALTAFVSTMRLAEVATDYCVFKGLRKCTHCRNESTKRFPRG